MKKYKFNIKKIAFFLALTSLLSCEKDLLEKPAVDGFTSDNFYSSDDQVQRTTYMMYGKLWAPFFTKCFFALTELSSGNLYGYVDGNEVIQFKLTSDSSFIGDPWKTCFAVVAQSNNLINNLESSVKAGVSPAVVKNTIAEAHFFRAAAYFYLVRLYGPVPIIEDNLALSKNPMVNTNKVEDIYTFIENDLKFAAANLKAKKRTESPSNENIFLSQGSAEAYLAKVYITQKKYSLAQQMAEKVINSGEFSLMPKFGDLYLTKNNNNAESIYSWQWSGAVNEYQAGNFSNVQLGMDILNDGASYGAVYMPTNDIQAAFKAGDLRRKETYMVYGDNYPELKAEGVVGFTLDKNKKEHKDLLNSTGAVCKKYVVGQVTGETGPADNWGGMSNCNYIMRYADLLLIHAEAIMGENPATNSVAAKNSFNMIRKRAGLAELGANEALTHDDLFKERRLELAFEGDYWFDLIRLPRQEAISIISKQDRGDDNGGGRYYTPTANDFVYPKPSTEVRKNPKLAEPPVPYVFK